MADRLRITETSDSDMKERYWDKFYRPQRQQVGPLTAEREVAWGVLRLTSGNNQDDLATIETAIEAVNGVDDCELVVSGQVPTANDIPADYEVYATVEGRFVLQENAV